MQDPIAFVDDDPDKLRKRYLWSSYLEPIKDIERSR